MDEIRPIIRHLLLSQDVKFKFFGLLLMQIPIEENNELDTMGIYEKNGKIHLGYNKKFINSLRIEQLEYALLHEVYHIVFNHIKRSNNFKDLNIPLEVINIAADCAVNSLIGEPNIEGAVWPYDLGLPKGETFEEYVNLLVEKIKEKDNNTSGNNNNNNKNKNKNKKDKEQKSSKDIFKDIKPIDDHSKWDEVCDGVAYEKLINEVKEVFERMKGSLPSDLVKEIELAFKPRINWKIKVRSKLYGEYVIDKHIYSYSRQSRRRPELIGVIPGKQKLYSDKVFIFIDTSGSMSDEDVKEAFSFSISIPYPKEIYQIDTEIKGKPIKLKGKAPIKKISRIGYGGTDFRPAFELAKENKAKIILFFTDLFGEFPKEDPKIKTYWIKFGDSEIIPPFGEVIELI